MLLLHMASLPSFVTYISTLGGDLVECCNSDNLLIQLNFHIS